VSGPNALGEYLRARRELVGPADAGYRNPSPQMLESLARVLGLDAAATQYLLSLTAPRTGSPRRPRRETVPTGIRQNDRPAGSPRQGNE
jgi:hypothetical protein